MQKTINPPELTEEEFENLLSTQILLSEDYLTSTDPLSYFYPIWQVSFEYTLSRLRQEGIIDEQDAEALLQVPYYRRKLFVFAMLPFLLPDKAIQQLQNIGEKTDWFRNYQNWDSTLSSQEEFLKELGPRTFGSLVPSQRATIWGRTVNMAPVREFIEEQKSKIGEDPVEDFYVVFDDYLSTEFLKDFYANLLYLLAPEQTTVNGFQVKPTLNLERLKKRSLQVDNMRQGVSIEKVVDKLRQKVSTEEVRKRVGVFYALAKACNLRNMRSFWNAFSRDTWWAEQANPKESMVVQESFKTLQKAGNAEPVLVSLASLYIDDFDTYSLLLKLPWTYSTYTNEELIRLKTDRRTSEAMQSLVDEIMERAYPWKDKKTRQAYRRKVEKGIAYLVLLLHVSMPMGVAYLKFLMTSYRLKNPYLTANEAVEIIKLAYKDEALRKKALEALQPFDSMGDYDAFVVSNTPYIRYPLDYYFKPPIVGSPYLPSREHLEPGSMWNPLNFFFGNTLTLIKYLMLQSSDPELARSLGIDGYAIMKRGIASLLELYFAYKMISTTYSMGKMAGSLSKNTETVKAISTEAHGGREAWVKVYRLPRGKTAYFVEVKSGGKKLVDVSQRRITPPPNATFIGEFQITPRPLAEHIYGEGMGNMVIGTGLVVVGGIAIVYGKQVDDPTVSQVLQMLGGGMVFLGIGSFFYGLGLLNSEAMQNMAKPATGWKNVPSDFYVVGFSGSGFRKGVMEGPVKGGYGMVVGFLKSFSDLPDSNFNRVVSTGISVPFSPIRIIAKCVNTGAEILSNIGPSDFFEMISIGADFVDSLLSPAAIKYFTAVYLEGYYILTRPGMDQVFVGKDFMEVIEKETRNAYYDAKKRWGEMEENWENNLKNPSKVTSWAFATYKYFFWSTSMLLALPFYEDPASEVENWWMTQPPTVHLVPPPAPKAWKK